MQKYKTNLRLHQRATKKIKQILSTYGLQATNRTPGREWVSGRWFRQLWGQEGRVPCLTGNGPVLNGHILTTILIEVSVNGKKIPVVMMFSKYGPGT